MNFKVISAVVVAFALAACSSVSSNPSILTINGLGDSQPGRGTFRGIEASASKLPDGRKRIHVLYTHGMGWTQEKATLGDDFASAVADFYGFSIAARDTRPSSLCPLSATRPNDPTSGGIRVQTAAGLAGFRTDLVGEYLWVTEIGCVDRQVFNEGGAIEVVLYRLFWDDAFYNGLQAPHLGYDDGPIDGWYADLGADNPPVEQPAYSRVAPLRQRINSELKDGLITRGISDAAMYISPAGEQIREALRATICLAARDSGGDASAFHMDVPPTGGNIVTEQQACFPSHAASSGSLAFVTESLGSRVLFDVLRDAQLATGPNLIAQAMAMGPEAFLLANQIPFIGLGKLQAASVPAQTGPTPPKPLVTLVAFSEVNDLLTYELVPYAEQLWLRTVTRSGSVGNLTRKRAELLDRNNTELRKQLEAEFGFHAVDVRSKFAGPFLGLVPSLADPMSAHTGHNRQPINIQLMLCGATAGIPRGTSGSCDQ